MTSPRSHTNESGLVAAIVRAVRREHPSAWVLKTAGGPYQAVGVPDLLICVGGRLYAFEVKHRKPGESEQHARGRATARQRWHLAAIRQAGGTALVVTDVAEVLGALASPD